MVVKSGKKLKQYFPKNKDIPCNCYICENMGIPCKTRNFIYQATCLPCKNNSKESIYLGASARQGKERMLEYESGIRLPQQADRTTLGRHKAEFHPTAPNDIEKCFKFKIIDRGNDPLDTMLREGIHIKNKGPSLNGKFNNGFII